MLSEALKYVDIHWTIKANRKYLLTTGKSETEYSKRTCMCQQQTFVMMNKGQTVSFLLSK